VRSLRSRRQSKSAFGARNPNESSGSAGNPPKPRHTAIAIVAPNDAVIATHVQLVLSRNRAYAARKSVKKSRSGTPRCAAVCSPGIGKAYDSAVNTCA
jgi:hypothetical protein